MYDEYEMPTRVVHTVEVDVRLGQYVATILYKCGGNCKGASILSGAISHVEDWEFNSKDVKVGLGKDDDDGYITELTLIHEELYPKDSTHPRATFTLQFEDAEDRRTLANHIVAVRIVDWEEEN